jgi:ribose-phosphate pyrophosphokinase
MGIPLAEAEETTKAGQELNSLANRSLKGLMLFSGNAHPELAKRVAAELGIGLGNCTSTRFSDGEIRVKIDESARGNHVFLLQPTCSPVNDTLMELFIMLDAFRRASAKSMTVVMPYYGYARQDKKVQPREPITARLVADMLTQAGAQRVVTIDLHADQIQGFFNVPVDHLYGGPIIGNYMLAQGYADEDIVVVSPDVAGVGRASRLAELLGKPFAVIAKKRPEPNKVEVVEVIGTVSGKKCVIIDDMIDTGGSIIKGAEGLMLRGAKEVVASCTHGVFSNGALHRLQASEISQIIALDTIPIRPENQVDKLTVLPSAPLISDAIRRIFLNESVSELFHKWR